MTIRATTIRLFVSSTFVDFQREREILQQEVFPALQRLCHARGVSFQPVDLRWGIGPEAAHEQQTLRICLDEVKRCAQTSLRPYFLVLTGDRYGWQPLPPALAPEEVRALLPWIARHEGRHADCPVGVSRELALLYRLDRNGVPPKLELQPQSVLAGQDWATAERRLLRALRRAALATGMSQAAREKFFLSATAHEIEQGVLQAPTDVPNVREHVLCFQRRRLDFRNKRPGGAFLNRDDGIHALERSGADDVQSRQLQSRLQRRLARALGDNVLVYHAFSTSGTTDRRFEQAFRDDARRLLTALVHREVERLSAFGGDQAEWLYHEEFGANRASTWSGRTREVDRLDRYLDRRDARSMLIHGVGGIGKTTLVAIAAAMGEQRGLVVLQRYVGTTATATNGRSLLISLLRQLEVTTGLASIRSNDIAELGAELRRLLEQAARRSPEGVLLAIDGLDQFEASDPARRLEWLPLPVPDRVALLLSSVDGELQRRLAERLPFGAAINVRSLARNAGREALRALLRKHDRRLQPSQEALVMDGFRVEGSPLYMRLAAEVARTWPAFAGQAPHLETLPSSTVALIERLFDLLATPRRHGHHLVAAVLGLISASRHGLSEHELITLLSTRPSLMMWVRGTSPEARRVTTLPFIFWARLRDDLDPFLAERSAEQTPVLALFHRMFDEAARRRYFAEPATQVDLRRSIAKHFSAQPTWLGAGPRRRPNLRKLSELPHQLSRLEDGRGLTNLLIDPDYGRAKIAAGLEADLYGEFQHADELCQGESRKSRRKPLLEAMFSLIEVAMRRPREFERFDLELLHAALAHRRTSSFYADFLLHCRTRLLTSDWRDSRRLQRLRLGIDLRIANLARRDNALADAQRQLTALLPQARRCSVPAEVSRIEYDLGYIEFLRGELSSAALAFELSARTSLDAGRLVGHGISRCMAEQARWLECVARGRAHEGASRYLTALSESEAVFRRQASSEAAAFRWLCNVAVHRFRVAFRTGDRALAQHALDALESDVWLSTQPGGEVDLAMARARMLMIEGDFTEGARRLEQTARVRFQQMPSREAQAENFFDAGMSHDCAGANTEAHVCWKLALTLAPDAGNRPWQALCRAALVGRLPD